MNLYENRFLPQFGAGKSGYLRKNGGDAVKFKEFLIMAGLWMGLLRDNPIRCCDTNFENLGDQFEFSGDLS